MRLTALPALVVVSMSTFGGGCAHTLETAREDRVLGAVDVKRAEPITAIAEPPPALAGELAAARPRLSRTVTLGEGTVEPLYTTQAQVAGGSPRVVVNNNVTIVGAPSVYGGYGYGRDTWRSDGDRDGTGARAGQNGPPHAWAPSGWEAAGRTAAPGDTPHVGGNWAAPPSHGARQLK